MSKNPENKKDNDNLDVQSGEGAADTAEVVEEPVVEVSAESEANAQAASDASEDVVEMEAYEVDSEDESEATDDAGETPKKDADENAASGAAQASSDEAFNKVVSERDDLKDQVLRARAEFDNYRKRILREGAEQRKRAAEQLLRDLLPVVDNLERALAHSDESSGEHLVEGVKMVYKQFLGVLDNYHVNPIVAVGEAFDPNLHEAMTQQPSEKYEEGVVMDEFERGYLIGERVLRPSRVLVSSGAPQATEELAEDNEATASEETE